MFRFMTCMALVAMLFCSLAMPTQAQAVEHQTVYATAQWIQPEFDELWAPWMGGKTIAATISVATTNGQYNYFAYATIDYETANCSCVMDATGLPPGYPWAMSVRVFPQVINGPGGASVTVSSNMNFKFYTAGTTQADFTKTVNVGLLKLE